MKIGTGFSNAIMVRRGLFLAFAGMLCGTVAMKAGLADSATAAQQILSNPVYRADDYYLGRHNLANVYTGLGILQGIVAKDALNYEAWWRIAKFYNYLARFSNGGKHRIILQQAVTAGEKAVALQPQRVEGHFWLGASYGLLAEDSNFLEGLSMVDEIRAEMEAAVKIDPNYEEAAAVIALGRMDYRVPFFKGGNLQRSVQLLEKSLRLSPDNSLAMLYLADSYRAAGRLNEARNLLDRILNLCPDPGYSTEVIQTQTEARKELSQYFHASR
ncbi:MAG TPA: tetratricopeptide repeat protein [Terriglobia bacterium]|nr:tetratricopeptide repeat protein [Terriglobia bacterium]